MLKYKLKNIVSKKIVLTVLIILLFYIGTRALFYYVTSPKQVDGAEGRTVYDIVKLTDEFMDNHDINISKGSSEYIGWLCMSLMGQLDKDINDDLRNQEWYSDYETYAARYLTEEQTMGYNSIREFFGYHIVVPSEMRDKTIKEIEDTIPVD